MKRRRLVAALGVFALFLSVLVGLDLHRGTPVYSQTFGPIVVVNNSGRALPVYDGWTMEPVSFDEEPWVIWPDEEFVAYPWEGYSRIYVDGWAYFFVGDEGEGDDYRFYLVEDWILNLSLIHI